MLKLICKLAEILQRAKMHSVVYIVRIYDYNFLESCKSHVFNKYMLARSARIFMYAHNDLQSITSYGLNCFSLNNAHK